MSHKEELLEKLARFSRECEAIEAIAMPALELIVNTINDHPTTGQTGVLVAFLAGIYNSRNNRFELDELKRLDHDLATACIKYLNYDRLGRTEVHRHLPGGAKWLHRQMLINGQLDQAEFDEWYGEAA